MFVLLLHTSIKQVIVPVKTTATPLPTKMYLGNFFGISGKRRKYEKCRVEIAPNTPRSGARGLAIKLISLGAVLGVTGLLINVMGFLSGNIGGFHSAACV